MIKPYTAVGLIPTVRGIRKRKDITINLEHLHHLVKAASWLSALDIPVKLIAKLLTANPSPFPWASRKCRNTNGNTA